MLNMSGLNEIILNKTSMKTSILLTEETLEHSDDGE